MSEFRKIVHAAGELIDYETVFEENSTLRTGVPTKKGTVERVDYVADVYEDGIEYKKTAYVYLPYGYDQNDKSKKYNVLYFQHGNTCEPAMFAIGGNKPMFDMLFESGEIEPCIIAFITYYMDPMRDAEARTQTGFAPAGDGIWPSIKSNYVREVLENIIPAIEGRYNTYLEVVSDAGIKASRDHRAFSGYSRGCGFTYRMIHHAVEYFRWFAPMSGTTWLDPQLKEGETMGEIIMAGWALPPEVITDYVTAGIKAHPELPVFLYFSNGGDEDIKPMNGYMKFLPKDPCFSYGTDPVKNNIYYSVSDYYHTDYLVPYYFWNSLKVIFKA